MENLLVLGVPILKHIRVVCGRPTLALATALVHQKKQLRSTQTKHRREAKRAAGIVGQVTSML